MREDYTIAIGVLKRLPPHIPVRIEGFHCTEASLLHAPYRLLVTRGLGQVEDKQVVLRRRPARIMALLLDELEVVGHARVAEQNALPALRPECQEQLEAQPVAVEGEEGLYVICWASDAQ